MKYSIINGERVGAQSGLKGECPVCGAVTIARCGTKKAHHWSHKGTRMCDPWWENETEWHRNWKNCFPEKWQEIIHHDDAGERHIADVKTDQGYVIEFQHSYLQPQEREKRTKFYEKILWVVDGKRRKRDEKQFLSLLLDKAPVFINPQVQLLNMHWVDLECALLWEWLDTNVPVFFDFGGDVLWCRLPKNKQGNTYAVGFPRSKFVEIFCNKSKQVIDAFDDCLKKLNIFAAENDKNQSYKIELQRYFVGPMSNHSQKIQDLYKRANNHFIMLEEKFKAVMKSYFQAGVEI